MLSAGAVLYAIGLPPWPIRRRPACSTFPPACLGFGLAGSSFTVVIGAFGKLMPPEWRTLAFGAGTAAGSFGQFLFSPLAVALIDAFGWQQTLVIFAAIVLLISRCRCARDAEVGAGDRGRAPRRNRCCRR